MQLPALIENMDFATYLADPMPEPSLTSSLVKKLLQTAPRKTWQKTPRLNRDAVAEQDNKFDLGSAAHRLFTGVGAPIVEIDAPAFTTAAAKAARDKAYSEGKTPILKKNMPRVLGMARAALEQVQDNKDIGHLFKPTHDGTELRPTTILRETTMLWMEEGVYCRSRPDFYSAEENTIIHYKTTGTDIAPETLSKFAANQGWDIVAAHYRAGARMLTGKEPRQFFVVQETDEPYLLLTAELDSTFLESAAMRRERALMVWGRCVQSNAWPGMPTRTVLLECPEWHERNIIAAKDAELAAIQEGTDLLEMMRMWQAPEGWQPPAVQGMNRDEREVIE